MKMNEYMVQVEELINNYLKMFPGYQQGMELQRDDNSIPMKESSCTVTNSYFILNSPVIEEWGASTFIIPKKDGSVRFITDFCELNKCIKCKP
jgi:hypothetical protein